MNLNYTELLPADFAGESRVWIYQSSRLFLPGEALQIEAALTQFVGGWKSHGTPVKGYAGLFFGQFIILLADESASGISGCSTDSSVHLVKQLEQQFSIELFDRQSLAFLIKEKVQIIPLSQIKYAAENKLIDEDSLYFNNTVQTKDEMNKNWIIPVRDSWLAKRINFKNVVSS
jgi:hypothetical protein